MGEEELGPLPAGRHGFSREQVAHNQRERLIAGLAEAIAENGYSGTTIAHITRHAAVSRRIIAGKAEELEELLPDLVEFTLTPYLGSAEAAKIAAEKD